MFQIFSFLLYWLKRVDQHSLHSPFVFQFFTEVIRSPYHKNSSIESIRKALRKSKADIKVKDFGAGSRVSNNNIKSIGSIAKHASTPSKFSRLLSKAIDHFGYTEILELGTSLGINTLYLSQTKEVNITTFEGDPIIAGLATSHFEKLGRENIEVIIGNIDQTLPDVLKRSKQIDLVYIDANHRYEPTLRYFESLLPLLHERSLVVIDDIHWSKEMNEAWGVIKDRTEVSLSIDLFEAGLLFFDPNIEKSDYILKF